MAFSQQRSTSVRKGQIALVCQLCEIEPKIKWKCIDCGLMMCQRCRDKVHPKFPSTKDHTIIDIKDISQHQAEPVKQLDFTKLKCGVHNQNYCCLYCKLCDQLLCQSCVAETHNKHKVCEHTNKLLAELDQNWANISNSVDEEERKVKETENRFQEQNDIVDEVLQSNDVEKVFSTSLLKLMKIKIPPINTVFDHIKKFVAGDILEISKLYGKLKNVTLPYDTSLHKVQQYTTNLKQIFSITACPDGSLWINDAKSEVLKKVNPVVDTVKVISKFDLLVKDMALLPSSDLLMSVKGSSSLKLIPSDSQEVKDTPYNVSPLITVGVHMTAKNKVIIGGRNTGPAWPSSRPRHIIVMDQTGQQEKVFQYDSHNIPLFTSAVHITSNSNNNIAVVDRVSNYCTGRVVVLYSGGGVRNVYTGHPNVNNHENPFQPCGIVTTPSDNFVVTDDSNHTLHILNSEGDIITFYNTREIGIELPFSLTFSSTGQLYIGCRTYSNRKDLAKIFLVDNFVWLQVTVIQTCNIKSNIKL